MALSLKTILIWLDTDAGACTLEQLHVIQEALDDAKTRARQRERIRTDALAQMQALAKAAGYETPEALLLATSGGAALPALQGRRQAVPRKPYFDPLDPNPELLAIAHRSDDTLPAWWHKRISEGWTPHELHWRNHKKGLERLHLTPVHEDSEVVYKDLLKKEPRALQRAKK